MPAPQPTDYERLVQAFDDLELRGYAAPLSYGWRVCCQTCGHSELDGDYPGLNDMNGYVFPHQQSYWPAFSGDDGPPTPELVKARIAPTVTDPDDPDAWYDAEQSWLDASSDAEDRHAIWDEAAERERLTRWHTMSGDVVLYWGATDGGVEIAEVFSAHGFGSDPPPSPHQAIFVSPGPARPARPHP
jgi:hypothetical protein